MTIRIFDGGVYPMALVPSPTRVVHCKKEPFDVYIGRPSKWGNPFTIGQDGTREEVVEKYKNWLLTEAPSDLFYDVINLRGKILGCWCKPKVCHGDILAKLADSLIVN